jgi:hypothetical protein
MYQTCVMIADSPFNLDELFLSISQEKSTLAFIQAFATSWKPSVDSDLEKKMYGTFVILLLFLNVHSFSKKSTQ